MSDEGTRLEGHLRQVEQAAVLVFDRIGAWVLVWPPDHHLPQPLEPGNWVENPTGDPSLTLHTA